MGSGLLRDCEEARDGAPRRELRKELKKLEVINRLEDVSPGMTTSSP